MIQFLRNVLTNRWFLLVVAVPLFVLGGCMFNDGARAVFSTPTVSDAITQANGQKIMGLGVLDLIFSLGMLGAAGACVAAFLGRGSVMLAAGLGCTAIGAAIVKIILVKFLALAVVLSIVALFGAGAYFAYMRIGWFERLLNIDLDHDGTIGS